MKAWRRRWWPGVIVAAVVGATGALAIAAAPKAVELPGVKSYLSHRAELLERDIAQRVMRRAETPPNEVAVLELQIDLRIVARHLLSVALDAKPESDLQVNTYLRAVHLMNATAGLETALRAQAGNKQPLARTQSEAITRIHQLSFNLGEQKTGPQLDELGKTLGLLILRAGSANAEVRAAPLMRPNPALARQKARPRPTAPAPAVARSVEQLTDEIRQAPVSVPLRQQLFVLAQATAAAADEKAKDAGDLYGVLCDAVDLAKGLASNTAVAIEARNLIERQLAEAVALYTDPRTRAAGQGRLDGLAQYRQVLSRVGRLALPAELKGQLAPLFAWVQENPEPGLKLLAALDKYATLTARYDQSIKSATTSANLTRAMDDLRKQFDSRRGDFLQDAGHVSARGILGVRPEDLQAGVDEMGRALRVMEILVDLPQLLDVLGNYKPRPTGALERRVAQAALAASNPKATNRAESEGVLEQVSQLAKAAQGLAAPPGEELTADQAASVSGGKYAAMEAKWKEMVSELASQLAGDAEMDKARFARLAVVHQLREAAGTAAGLQDPGLKATLFTRWADWTVPPEQLQALLAPWREALAGAFAGFAEDKPEAIDRWNKVNRRFAPMVALVERAYTYADQIAALPTGLVGDVGRLVAPMDGQPFATERYVSFAMELWAAWEAQDDTATADTVSFVVARRIGRDLRLPFKDDDAGPVRPPKGGATRDRTKKTIFDDKD